MISAPCFAWQHYSELQPDPQSNTALYPIAAALAQDDEVLHAKIDATGVSYSFTAGNVTNITGDGVYDIYADENNPERDVSWTNIEFPRGGVVAHHLTPGDTLTSGTAYLTTAWE